METPAQKFAKAHFHPVLHMAEMLYYLLTWMMTGRHITMKHYGDECLNFRNSCPSCYSEKIAANNLKIRSLE